MRPDMLANPRSERVNRVAALSGRSARLKHDQLLVEGPQAVRELLMHRAPTVRDVYLTDAARQRHPDVAELAAERVRFVHLVSPQVARAMSPDCQGVLAVSQLAAIAGRQADIADVVAGARLVVVLPAASDPGNVGTIIRAADACGADAMLVAVGSVDVTSPKVVRATAGSLFHLPVLTGLELPNIAAALRQAGLQILGADGYGSLVLEDSGELLAAPTAWVLGNEAHGLGQAEKAICDDTVRITLHGAAESLNVAAAAAIVLHATAHAQHAARA